MGTIRMIREQRYPATMEVGSDLHLQYCRKPKIDLDIPHMLDIAVQGPQAGADNVLVVVIVGLEGDMYLQTFVEDQGSGRLDTMPSRFPPGIERGEGSE